MSTVAIQPYSQALPIDNALVGPVSMPRATTPAMSLPAPGNVSSAGSVQIDISTPSRLQNDRHGAIELGGYARQLDGALARAADLAAKMREQLNSITKQFPPFPADSQERFQYLNGFSGLRDLFESLSFPKEPDANGQWTDLQIPGGRVGWSVPSLDPSAATDEQIRATEEAVQEINSDIVLHRQGLRASVGAAVGFGLGVEEAHRLSRSLGNWMSA